MAFTQPTFREANSELQAENFGGKKKRARASQTAETVRSLAGQPLSKAAQLSAVLASDGRISKRDARLIRKAGKKEAGTERRTANALSRSDRTTSRQQSKAERQEARQYRKKAVGIAQAESAAAQGLSANANDVQAMPPVKQGQVAALDNLPTPAMQLSGGGGGGDTPGDQLNDWNDKPEIQAGEDETKEPSPVVKQTKDVAKQVFIGVLVLVLGYFIFKFVIKKK